MRAHTLLLLLAVCVPHAASAGSSSRAGAEDAARVAEAIIETVQSRMGDDAEVVVSELTVTGGDSPAFLQAVPEPDARLGERVHFRLLGSDGRGEAARTVGRASAVVAVNVEHVRAKELVARGRDVADSDFETSHGRLVGVPMRRLPRWTEVAGSRALVNLAPGEVITRSAVTIKPAVKSGQVVRAIARVGGLEVTAALVAVQDGAPGSVIRVVNRESRRELRARVLESGVVEVIP